MRRYQTFIPQRAWSEQPSHRTQVTNDGEEFSFGDYSPRGLDDEVPRSWNSLQTFFLQILTAEAIKIHSRFLTSLFHSGGSKRHFSGPSSPCLAPLPQLTDNCLHLVLSSAKLFQIFLNHLQPCHLWSTLTIRASEFWMVYTFLYLYSSFLCRCLNHLSLLLCNTDLLLSMLIAQYCLSLPEMVCCPITSYNTSI